MAPGPGSSSSMASGSSTTTSTRPAPRRLSTVVLAFNPAPPPSSSMEAAAPAGVPGSSPSVAPPPNSSRTPSGSSARPTTSFDPAGSSALAPADYPGRGLSALAPEFYPTTASSSSTAAMPRVSECLPPIARPTASSLDFPPEMLWHHPCTEVKIKGARLDLLGSELDVLAEQRRLIQMYNDLKENHLLQKKEIMNIFILEKRRALGLGVGQDDELGKGKQPMGVEQDQLGDCKQALRVNQDQVEKEQESQCLKKLLQDVNGEQPVGALKLGLPGAEESIACKNIAAHKEIIRDLPVSEIEFGSINLSDIPFQGRQAALAKPNPEVDRRTSDMSPARASSQEQEPDAEQNLPVSEIMFGSINLRDIPLQGRQAADSKPNPEVDRRTSVMTPARASSPEKEPDPEPNEKHLK